MIIVKFLFCLLILAPIMAVWVIVTLGRGIKHWESILNRIWD